MSNTIISIICLVILGIMFVLAGVGIHMLMKEYFRVNDDTYEDIKDEEEKQ